MSKRSSPATDQVLSCLRVQSRFMRSVNLERDLHDRSSSRGYIVTATANEAWSRIAAGCEPSSTQRAWRITGDYGTGKSDFTLALARWMSGHQDELPPGIPWSPPPTSSWLVRVATGRSERLATTVLRALGITSPQATGSVDAVVAHVEKAAQRARRAHGGLLIVIDELGKNLEYAVAHPEQDDVFLLQTLAEAAIRSGDTPFMLVVLVHQGISAYASALAEHARREWEKVAGRFAEIVFAHPAEQLAGLISAVLQPRQDLIPRPWRESATNSLRAVIGMGALGAWRGTGPASTGTEIFPLHPTTLPVVLRIMHRYAQHERSLLGFFVSQEPHGFLAFCQRQPLTTDDDPFYRIHHFYHYVQQHLFHGPVHRDLAQGRWQTIREIVAATPCDSPHAERLIKTIALLSLVDAVDLPATRDLLVLAAGGDQRQTDAVLATLIERRVLFQRGIVRALSLWPHTSVDLEAASREARERTRPNALGVADLCQAITSRNLVPRSYYATTGILRHAQVLVQPAAQHADLLTTTDPAATPDRDLVVHVLLPATARERQVVADALQRGRTNLAPGRVIVLAAPQPRALAALHDVLVWTYVQEQTPALMQDRFARQEVASQRLEAQQTFCQALGGLDDLSVPVGGPPLTWYSRRCTAEIAAGPEALRFIGAECAAVYPRSPRIANELLNRRTPSTAAVSARTKLVEAMTRSPHVENLGMEGTRRPPEMALYLSILRKGGFHHEDGVQGWRFRLPDAKHDALDLVPTIDRITSMLVDGGSDAAIGIPDIFAALGQPPFGIREGLRPLILAIYLATHTNRVALYEDGTYLHQVGGNEMLRLMKEPQAFTLQYSSLDGIRHDVFLRIMDVLLIERSQVDRSDVLDLVRPLSMFIAREIPDYARQTQKLPLATLNVRQVLLTCRSPIDLIFRELPIACGLSAVGGQVRDYDTDAFAIRLRSAMHGLRTAHAGLLKRLTTALQDGFGLDDRDVRHAVAARARALAVHVSEPRLRSFCLRLGDETLAPGAWLESLANFLTGKSTERWQDQDEDIYHQQLQQLVARFKRAESLHAGTSMRPAGDGCRIAIMRSDGTEVGLVVDRAAVQDARFRSASDDWRRFVAAHGQHGIVAALDALWITAQSVQSAAGESHV